MENIRRYHNSNNVQYDTSLLVVERFFSMLTWKKNESIMDIGMGDGKFTVEGLLPKLPTDLELLLGCDIIPDNVNFARNTYSSSTVKFDEIDIGTKNLRKDFIEKFDHIFSFFVLHWMKNLRQALRNIYDMMKPGGEFLFVLVEDSIDRPFYNLSKYPRWARYGHEEYISSFFNKDSLLITKSLLQETGFTDLNCFREYNVYRQPNKKTCEDMFKSINPIAKLIPQQDLDDYYRDFITELYRSGLSQSTINPVTLEEIVTTNFVTIIVLGKKPEKN